MSKSPDAKRGKDKLQVGSDFLDNSLAEMFHISAAGTAKPTRFRWVLKLGRSGQKSLEIKQNLDLVVSDISFTAEQAGHTMPPPLHEAHCLELPRVGAIFGSKSPSGYCENNRSVGYIFDGDYD